jgi:hypothetical protein
VADPWEGQRPQRPGRTEAPLMGHGAAVGLARTTIE